MKVKIKTRSPIARVAATIMRSRSLAIVFGKTIYLHNCDVQSFLKNKRWVKHELTHIMQYRQYGFLRFLWLYLIESIKHGYYNNRFEVEARSMETAKIEYPETEFIT